MSLSKVPSTLKFQLAVLFAAPLLFATFRKHYITDFLFDTVNKVSEDEGCDLENEYRQHIVARINKYKIVSQFCGGCYGLLAGWTIRDLLTVLEKYRK